MPRALPQLALRRTPDSVQIPDAVRRAIRGRLATDLALATERLADALVPGTRRSYGQLYDVADRFSALAFGLWFEAHWHAAYDAQELYDALAAAGLTDLWWRVVRGGGEVGT